MSFKDDITKLSIQINERKEYITNEEMTKQSLIIPFIQTLGFDVFNPLEVRPEYTADFGIKKGEKVDYALFKDKDPIIFIEAKSVNEKLENHNAQLSRYFNSASDVKLGILTNGIEYKFFTDLNNNNIMDDTPFLTIDFSNIKETDVENLMTFRKDSFDKENLINYAEELVYTNALNDTLRTLLKTPSDDFIRFIIKDFSENMRVTNNVIERFRPLVKKAISNAVLEMVSKGLDHEESPCEELENKEKETIEQPTDNIIINNQINKRKGIITTDDELKAYEIVKNILTNHAKDCSEVYYKDTTNYFCVYNKFLTRWIIRINLDAKDKSIMFKIPLEILKEKFSDIQIDVAPKGIAESRIYINNIEDIEKYSEIIVMAYDLITQE